MKLEEVLMEGNKSKKAAQIKQGEQPHLACRIRLQNKSATQDRKNRVTTSRQCHKKDIAPGKNINCLPEAGQKNPDCMQSAKKHRCSLIKLGVQEKVKNISSSSDLKRGTLKKTWNFRSRTKLIQFEQKTCGNHVEGQRTKRRSLSLLEHRVQNINLSKYREKKGALSCCKSQLHSPENLRGDVEERRPSSITHISSGNHKEERELIAKSSRSRLVKSKKPEIKTKNSVAVTTSKMPDGVEAQEQNKPCFLKCASNGEDTEKFEGTTEEGIHMTVTQAFLKSNMCKNDELQSSVVSNRQHGKLTEIDKDLNIQNLLELSTCLPVPKSDKTENSDCINPCFGREVAVYRDAVSSPLKDVKCPQCLDIKVVAEKVENNTLAVCQDAKRTWLAKHCDLPSSIERFPIVRLLDCCYIKSLLNPAGAKSIQSCKVHSGSLHVASSQGKVLPSGRDMRQNDLSNSPNLLQTGRFLPEESILVGKEMCQNSNRSSRCQNGKPFGERKQCVDFERPSKKIKMQRNLEKLAIQKVLTNVNMHSECGLQMEDKLDTKTFGGKLNYNETTCLSSLEHRTDFLLEQPTQKPQNQLVSLSCNEKVSEAQAITCDSSDIEKSLVLRNQQNVPEIKDMEPQINIDKNKKYDVSSVNVLDSEKMVSSNSSIGCSIKAKRICKDRTRCKAKKNLQAYSCQRVVPVSGKNVWPRESCARTSVWIHKNRTCDLEITLRSTDLLLHSGQEELHMPLIDTTKTLADMAMDHKAELPVESCTSGPVFHVDKTFSAIENESRFSSVDKPNRCPPEAKTRKKLKVSLDSLAKDVKNKRSISKRNNSIGVQNSGFSNGKSKTKEQKTSITKQELLLQTVSRNLSDFKIPLLKNKNEYGKSDYCRSSARNTCCLLDILEDATISRNKTGAEQTSSDESYKFHFQSEHMNVSISKEHANQFDSNYPECLYKENNEHMETSNESELKTSTLDNNFHSCSTDFKEMLIRENKDESNSNNLAQVKVSHGDIIQAYDDDVLVIDVIQDDPDLFGDIGEQETAYTKDNCTKTNFNTNIFSEQRLKSEPESPQLLEYRYLKIGSRESPVQDYERLESIADLSAEVDEVKSESASEISSIEGVTVPAFEGVQLTVLDDVTRSCITDAKYKFPEKMLAVKEEKANIWNIAKIENTQDFEPVSHDHHLELPLPTVKAAEPQWHNKAVEPWMNDFEFSRKDSLLPTSYPNSQDSWKIDKNGMTNLGLLHVPHRCCRYHFNTLKGCERANCKFHHVPPPGDEEFCSDVLKKYLSIGEVVLLQRAVQIFTDYCKRSIPRLYLDSQIFKDLLASLLQSCLLKELFLVVNTGIIIKILPSVQFLLKVFEQVASMKLKDTVPDLTDMSCKLFDAGLALEYEHICCITKFLNQLQVSNHEITTFVSRFQERHFKKASLCDFDSAVAEFQHCKEKGDWAKLGTLYVNVRRGCGDVNEKYSVSIANILTSVLKEKLRIPFCEFAAAVNADANHNEADKHLLGRIGISVMFSYYKKQQWSKAKKILDALHALQIPFTVLKGLLGYERLASRCSIINVAVEIFLKCECIDGAMWVLKESDWVINTLSWPCDRMDVLTRHNLLCTMASEYITKSQYGKAFEVLKNLPGFQNSCDTLDVSQYNILFNKLFGACLENKHLEISSAIVDFMFTKIIPVEFNLLRELITTLGRNCLWLKARTHYKSALGLGCYPPLEGNLYRKLLLIPSYMTEVEMLLAIEIFLVANASSIQSLGASSQLLQIVLKRCEANNVHKEDDYQSAISRLMKAACISTPKLSLKYLTVNIRKEEVYSLQYASVLSWLKENMKWAGKVWLF
uniref:Protein TOPAZ1 n=1 Tax=Anolis carolinensis TaxID=28377 RepID=G1KQG7_ANOCA